MARYISQRVAYSAGMWMKKIRLITKKTVSAASGVHYHCFRNFVVGGLVVAVPIKLKKAG
jgi:hypothetical protein